MQRLIKVKQGGGLTKGALRPNFALYKEFIGPPVIVPVSEGGSQYNVTQTSLIGKNGSYLPVSNINNEVSFLRGTSFTIAVTALNPDNQSNRTDISQLKFRWKKNGAYITSVNNLNFFKGVNVITFTEEQSTQEVSGTYTLEITNESGTTTAAPLIVNVYNRLNNPQLYRNLIRNGTGIEEFEGWAIDGNVDIGELYTYAPSFYNFGSIMVKRGLDKNQSGEYLNVQPMIPFKFDASPGALYGMLPLFKAYVSGGAAAFNASANSTSGPNIANVFAATPPNIVANENTGSSETYGCFFPSRPYMDEYNQNSGKVGLQSELREARTYFTRSPITRQTDDTATLTQTIDITELDNFADGLVCGVDKLVGHFFAYVGLGISNYEYVVKFQPWANLPDKKLNTLILTFDKLKKLIETDTLADADKVDLTQAAEIHLIPKCNDTIDFTFRYVNGFGSVIGEDTANGPTVDDVFAIKEKSILPLILSKLFTRTCKLPSYDLPVRYKGVKRLFLLREYNNMNDPMATFLKQNFTTNFFTQLNTTKKLYPDRGAAAFFGIQKKLYMPTGTRSVEVVVNMRHESVAYGLSEDDSGIHRYDISEVQAEHTTPPYKFFRSGPPKIGITQMKLCLYDNEYKRVAGYPSYYIPDTHIWSIRKKAVANRIEGYDTTDTTIRYADYTRDIIRQIAEEDFEKPEDPVSMLPRDPI